ncbi:MAG: HlyD family efflux transporter periplasmic adaptor subunit [bacterium]
MPTKNFHSEEVQDIMGRAPSWVVRWGITVIFVIFGGIFLGCYFIKYPNTIISNAEITTYNPPVELIARYEGLIDTLFVKEGEMVSKDALIAVLDNSSDWVDVYKVSSLLESFSYAECDKDVFNDSLYVNYNVGELQSSFLAFQKICKDYKHYLTTEQVNKKIRLIEIQISKTREYYIQLQAQHKYLLKDLELQLKAFERDSLLYADGVISASEMEIASQNLSQKKNAEAGFIASLTSNELQIIQLEQQLIELSMQLENETSEYERQFSQSKQQLLSDIVRWRQTYTIAAPIDGRITLGNYWSENQYVKIGDKLATIIPQSEARVIARVQIPSAGFGKVEMGQSVNIKLDGYPYMEFGVLSGTITSLSAVPEKVQSTTGTNIIYLAEVSLPHGLTTSYNKELPMIQQMNGTAEVITKDMRLIGQFFHPIMSLFRNR